LLAELSGRISTRLEAELEKRGRPESLNIGVTLEERGKSGRLAWIWISRMPCFGRPRPIRARGTTVASGGAAAAAGAEPMIHVMLPEQYLREARTRLAEPEKRLALAVLQTVLYDCRARAAVGDGPARVENQRAFELALAYVESHDRSWPYSFENLCETIGLDPGSLRRRIARTSLAVQ